jgi:hypothetical protein
MAFGGAIEVPIKQLKEIFQFGNHWHGKRTLLYKIHVMCHTIDVDQVRCLLGLQKNSKKLNLTP